MLEEKEVIKVAVQLIQSAETEEDRTSRLDMERKIEDWDRRKREIVDEKKRKDEEEKLQKSRQGVELSSLPKATSSGEGDKKSKPEGKIVEEIKEDGKKVEEKKVQVKEEFEPLLPVRRKEDI